MGESKREICRAELHPMSGDNLGINSSGQRFCKECSRQRNQRANRKWRAEQRALGVKFTGGKAIYPPGFNKYSDDRKKSDEQLNKECLEWIERMDKLTDYR